jgi:hypothetical protein
MQKRILRTRPRNPKNIRESLAVIASMAAPKMVILKKPGDAFNQHEARLEKVATEGFRLLYKTGVTPLWNGVVKESFTLQSHLFDFLAPRLSFRQAADGQIAASLTTLTTATFEANGAAYFRLVLPVHEDVSFRFYIDFLGFQAVGYNSVDCVRIDFKGLTLDAYYYEGPTHEKFFILDAQEKTTYEAFTDFCFAALISIGYVTGRFTQDEGYYFSYNDETLTIPAGFRFSRFRSSVKGPFPPIYAVAAGYLYDNLAEAARVQPTLRPLTGAEFTRICQWAYDSLEFRALLLLILEASAASLTIMPSALSVALEAMTALLVKKNPERYSPIKEKALAQQIKLELKKGIDLHASVLGKESIKILKANIDNINQPTNRAKLIRPFEAVGFTLTEADIEAIDHRNDFLHGSIAYLPDKEKESEAPLIDPADGSKKIYYIALRLYTLIAVLVLKSVKYDNKIVNYPAIHHPYYPKIKRYDTVKNEPFFRQI